MEDALNTCSCKRYKVTAEPLFSFLVLLLAILVIVVMRTGWPNPDVCVPAGIALVLLPIAVWSTDANSKWNCESEWLASLMGWIADASATLPPDEREAVTIENLGKTYLLINDDVDRLLEEYSGDEDDIESLDIKGSRIFISGQGYQYEGDYYFMPRKLDLVDGPARIVGEYGIRISADIRESIVPTLLTQDWMYNSAGLLLNLDDAVEGLIQRRFELLIESPEWSEATGIDCLILINRLFTSLGNELMLTTCGLVDISLIADQTSYTVQQAKA